MRCLLTTQSQNCYGEQIKKEMLTRLAWKSRYANLYPSCCNPRNNGTEPTQLPHLPADPQAVLPPVTRTPKKQNVPLPPPSPPPVLSSEGEGRPSVPPLMRPVSPQTRRALYQDSSHHGKGRSLYLQRRGRIRPEEKFDFPLLSSWEYGWRLGPPCATETALTRQDMVTELLGVSDSRTLINHGSGLLPPITPLMPNQIGIWGVWRLGDYTLDYSTPSRAKSSVVKNTFYARNGVFSSPSATDTLG